MSVKTLTSREFNHDAAAAKRATKDGAVYITNRGNLEAVLLSADEYKRLKGKSRSIIERLAYSPAADIELEIERSNEVQRDVVI